MDDIVLGVREILDDYAKLAKPAANLELKTDLFATGLDSMAVVNVMLALEERFDIEFPESRLTRAAFADIQSIATAVRQALEDLYVA